MNVIQVHNMPVHITALSLSAFTWQLFSTFLHVCVCVRACVRVCVCLCVSWTTLPRSSCCRVCSKHGMNTYTNSKLPWKPLYLQTVLKSAFEPCLFVWERLHFPVVMVQVNLCIYFINDLPILARGRVVGVWHWWCGSCKPCGFVLMKVTTKPQRKLT